jgi:hypothetical protein
MRMRLGWFTRCVDRQAATTVLNSLNPLTARDVMRLFPAAVLYREGMLGITKSFVVVGPAASVASMPLDTPPLMSVRV